MIARLMGIIEIGVGFYFIFSVATHTATTSDYLIFLLITLIFCMSMARGAKERRALHGEISKAKARSNYDRKKYAKMRQDLEAMDEEEFETHPINVQEFASKLYRGEVTLEDLPDTRSRAHIEYSQSHPGDLQDSGSGDTLVTADLADAPDEPGSSAQLESDSADQA